MKIYDLALSFVILCDSWLHNRAGTGAVHRVLLLPAEFQRDAHEIHRSAKIRKRTYLQFNYRQIHALRVGCSLSRGRELVAIYFIFYSLSLEEAGYTLERFQP